VPDAEMIGTTRPRVNFSMNKFRKLGFINDNDGLQINTSLLSVVLHEEANVHAAPRNGSSCIREKFIKCSRPIQDFFTPCRNLHSFSN
jgi:hypothetical protein